jgi:predicted RNase H-like HicB family nuclease
MQGVIIRNSRSRYYSICACCSRSRYNQNIKLDSEQDLDNYPEFIDRIRESVKNPGKPTMKSRNFTVIVYREDDVYIAECPEVGTVDQGETIEQAIAGLTAATKLYLEEFSVPETSPRFVTSIEVSYA